MNVVIPGSTLLEQAYRFEPIVRRHAQFLHELFHMRHFDLGNTTIRFGQFTHQNKNGFQENRLAAGCIQWIQAAGAKRSESVDEAADKITQYSKQ